MSYPPPNPNYPYGYPPQQGYPQQGYPQQGYPPQMGYPQQVPTMLPQQPMYTNVPPPPPMMGGYGYPRPYVAQPSYGYGAPMMGRKGYKKMHKMQKKGWGKMRKHKGFKSK
jgi:hypothetical protein